MSDFLLGDVDVNIIGDTIYLKGLPAKTLIKDLSRVYKYDVNAGEAFFRLIVSGFLIQRATVSFNRYFSLEVYSMLLKLYKVTNRDVYKGMIDELITADYRLRKYLTPPIPIPNKILNRLNDINIELFPYQKEFLNILYNSKYKLGLRGNVNAFGTGMGKCFAKGTKILMYDGTIKEVQDVKVNDKLMGWDSRPRNVISTVCGPEQMYQITQIGKSSYTVNESHILSLKVIDNIVYNNIEYNPGDIINISVINYINTDIRFKESTRGFAVPIEFKSKPIIADSYYIGKWATSTTIPTVSKVLHDYKCNTRAIRLQLLSGIIDSSNSHLDENDNLCIEIKNFNLVNDVIFVARSLGFSASIEINENAYTCILKCDTSIIPTKKCFNQSIKFTDDNLLYKIVVTKKSYDAYYGFTIGGPDRMFMLEDFTVVHNTVSVLASIYAMNETPCIITAPKSTLDSSWKQSILKFIPDIHPDEIQLVNSYNPKIRWKYLIANYERLDQAYQYSDNAIGSIKSLVIDESHNFRYLATMRSNRLLSLIEGLDLKTVIPISGTPIKARASEMIPIIKALDPSFTDEAAKIFKRMYGGDRYSVMCANILKSRLSIYIDREELSADNNSGFPTLERYDLTCTVKNPQRYYVSTIKKEMKAYIDKEIPSYANKQKPSFEKIKTIMDSIPDEVYSAEYKYDYVSQIKIKMSQPMSFAGKQAMEIIKKHESELKKAVPDVAKELINLRKLCTNYLQMLLGKAMGIYFVKRRIECVSQMVKDNVNQIAKIIDDSELKTMIFSIYIQPLEDTIKVLSTKNLNGMIIAGGSDTNEQLNRFYNDNTMDYFGAGMSIATGTDGIQKACSTLIILIPPYRSTDVTQLEARLYRRGAAAKVVKVYNLKLNTDERNLVDNAFDILDWSQKLFNVAMELENQNPQGTLKECVETISNAIDLLQE